ncbi:MAG: AraC family transcriptional regulator, partial [Lachnospiraceae bacterium]|nr:AraC family transcriptional regulator [Lachnospiraceae bacterium]
DCGFNGSNYFKDIFRKTTGYSPREFRKQSKQN